MAYHGISQHIIIADINTLIPNRTAYLIGAGEDPSEHLIHSAKLLCAMGTEYLIMPCNTSYYFHEKLEGML